MIAPSSRNQESETSPSTRRQAPRLERKTFCTSREMDFLSETELCAQTGHYRQEWPAVIVKELLDNALDACEEGDTSPEITVAADEAGITIADNGPGLPVGSFAIRKYARRT